MAERDIIIREDAAAQATMAAGFSVWRVVFSYAELQWSTAALKRNAPAYFAVLLSRFQGTSLMYPYGEFAGATAHACGYARPYVLYEYAKGGQGAAMAIPQGTVQTRCQLVDESRPEGPAYCLADPAGGAPYWWTEWWVYWRGAAVTAPWPVLRSRWTGKVLAAVDVISEPAAVRWDPEDLGVLDVAKKEAVKIVEQTERDVKKAAKSAGRSPWLWLGGAALAAWLARPLLQGMMRRR